MLEKFIICDKRLLWRTEKTMGPCPRIYDLKLHSDVAVETRPGRVSQVEQGPVITWQGGPAISWG